MEHISQTKVQVMLENWLMTWYQEFQSCRSLGTRVRRRNVIKLHVEVVKMMVEEVNKKEL